MCVGGCCCPTSGLVVVLLDYVWRCCFHGNGTKLGPCLLLAVVPLCWPSLTPVFSVCKLGQRERDWTARAETKCVVCSKAKVCIFWGVTQANTHTHYIYIHVRTRAHVIPAQSMSGLQTQTHTDES